jgi:hypothetical protein
LPALAAILALPIAVAGCDSSDGSAGSGGSGGAELCQLEYIGDKDAPIEMELVTLDPDYTAQPLASGGDVSILFPPNGSPLVFVGVRVKNLDPCAVRLGGAIRDPATSEVRLDTRTVNLHPTEDGWGTSDPSDISTFSNIPVCPNSWASTDVFDQTFWLDLDVRDRDGKEAQTDPMVLLEVVPRCNETKSLNGQDLQKLCLCLCKAGYITGEMCQ